MIFRLLSAALVVGLCLAVVPTLPPSRAVAQAAGSGQTMTVRPAMVEMFTSQGCSNCPAANAFLADLAQEKDVIALSFAVDYWDYLGWRDTFASPAFTARQYAYGRALHRPRIYTPQIVLNGRTIIKGTTQDAVRKAVQVAQHKPAPDAPRVQAKLDKDGNLVVNIEGRSDKNIIIWMAAYAPGAQKVKIGGGENNGKTVLQVNMVTRLDQVGTWTGKPARLVLPMPEDGGCAIFLQDDHHGPILAAVRVEV